ncbi:uncharacterized protein BDZ99DRAFT_269391 [Mytilinidion resinicola]|uniref:Uncharacterized protein n=1 Tax=Mytilinidion resinicola TaxID=574789 RepID=A0A6A6YXB2_9PEZI|nr:uncharacterized protein BDZ99DRAFT_269391 [Mytilinidion resinicola]KAF2812557.1 hypothetical protein BDZ99DRAFT_269391 [Mytilinidion resinicola]
MKPTQTGSASAARQRPPQPAMEASTASNDHANSRTSRHGLHSRVTSFTTSLFRKPPSRPFQRGHATQTAATATTSHGPSNPEATNAPPREATAADFPYVTYVARGGYLPDGSGGKISETRFTQIKEEIVPFNADRFVALVNSSEKMRREFDDIYGGSPTPAEPTDSELLRHAIARNQEWKDEVLQRLTAQLRTQWEVLGARIGALELEVDRLAERIADLEGAGEGTGEGGDDAEEAREIKQEEVEKVKEEAREAAFL